MSTQAYSRTTKTFHWLTALLVIAIIPLGVIASDAPISTDAEIATKTWLFSMHKTLGVAVFLVALARITYALTQTKPAPLHPDRKAETLLAEVVHWLLYLSLVLVPLTGWIHHSASAFAAPIWIPFANALPFVPTDPHVSDLFGGLHWLWSKIMVASILLHFAGAMKHVFIDKDETLKRMTFGKLTATAAADHGKSAPFIAVAVFAAIAALGSALGFYTTAQTKQNGPALEAAASEWTVTDGAINIAITQLGSTVKGNFSDWVSVISYDENGTGTVGRVETTINISSLALGTVTQQAMGADFFDQGTFPTAVFAADILRNGDTLTADGTLTIKGAAVPVSLPFDLTINGDQAQMNGSLTLDRRDFTVGESMADESNLGFDVMVDIAVTATR